jgi:hypothetical protein
VKGNGVASKYLTIEALRRAGMFVRYAQRNEAGKGSNRNMVRYLDDVDRHDLLKTLVEACQNTDWQVHAYCLMSNHYHLVIETPNANLVAGMTWLQSTYTIRLNHRHKLIGKGVNP